MRSALALGLIAGAAALVRPVAAAPTAVTVTDLTLGEPSSGKAVVRLATSGKPSWTARVTDGGTRLLIDIEGAGVDKKAPPALNKGNAIVGGVLLQEFASPGGKTTRMLVQLSSKAEYRVKADDKGLVLELERAEITRAMGSAPSPALGGAKQEAPAAKAPSASAATMSNVKFDHQAGYDRVVLELSGAAQHTELPFNDRLTLELRDVKLPDALQRKLDTKAFGGAVKSVSTYRKLSDPSRVVVEIERTEGAQATVQREGNHLVVTVGKGLHSSQSGVGLDGGAARRTKTVAREAPLTDVPVVEQSFGMAAGVKVQVSEPDQADAFLPGVLGQQKRFTGRRIDIDLKDADIHNVLRFISDVGRVNVVTADNVSGSVTIRMRDVPWDQALETILQAKGLGMVRTGNMIRVAPLADLNKERELAIARRKSELQLAPVETRLVPVSYAEAANLMPRAKDLLSPRGSLAVDERTNVLIARDVAGNLDQIEELIRALDTQTPQVLIEARIVEATSRYLRDVGIQWGGDATFGPATGNPTGLAFPSSIGVIGGGSDTQTPTGGLSPFTNIVPNPNFAVNLPATVGTGQGGALGLTFGSINNTVNLAVRLSAAESSGSLRIVSSPRVLTLDNREARIAQGTLIPFSQISAQGVQTVFQEAKLQLLVKPHVTSDGSVSMHVKINRDEPDFNQTSARGDPTILKREAETDLLIQDGHTAVIGGIFTRNTGRNVDQIPLLGDIPILGVLFQRRRATDSRSELVIFLTPRIVNRAESLGR
jgi:type IV pilus assembly protein PilQ